MYTPVGIELPEYCEWVRGTAYPKVSSGKPHGRLQIALGVIVYSWVTNAATLQARST